MKIDNDFTKSNDTVVVAVDVETSGPNFVQNGMLSLGASVQNLDMKEIASFSANIMLEEDMRFDVDCYENFWSKNPEAYQNVTTSAVSPKVAMTNFVSFLEKLENYCPNYYIISDNPTFDIAWINLYLSKYTSRKPLNYHMNGAYKMIWDSASVQKTWCALRKEKKFDTLPGKHRDLLGLKSSYPHDHTALNDARTIASFFIQTWGQMETMGKPLEEKVKSRKPLVIEKYTPQWSVFFENEYRKIKSVMGKNAVEIYHVGSTSVPSLAAKPIIDMILVTKDLNSARELLTSKELGYRYKGEYNLPLRDLYGKKGDFEVYLHVHHVNNPEIELNLLFRDYLRNNEEAKKQYESVKITASKDRNASEKVETGITKYNLLKNDLIVSILRETGFEGVCPRFVTQHAESEFFDKTKDEFFKDLGVEKMSLPSEQNVKKLVLYRGVDIVGAAEIMNISSDRFVVNFAWTNDNGKLLKEFLSRIENWVKIRTKCRLLEATVGHAQAHIYSDEGFIRPIRSNDHYFIKEI